ncbi:MAG: type II toxin-antitoxin system RelE/ParE family toxin [Sulfurimonas sp.]|nr:type II toxin-antitoxin system RelE/ParE family toxin [Sulfurimonas sp.]
MKIIYKTAFERELIQITDYIARDKKSASIEFAYELEKSILALVDNPLKYKQSLYFDDKNIRDMTYKTYTIIYAVNFEKDSIEIFKIFNKNKPS